MNKRQRPSRRKKSATAAAVICFVAAIAIVGTYTFSDYKKTQQKQQLAEEKENEDTKQVKEKEPSKEANNNLVINTPSQNKDDQVTNTPIAQLPKAAPEVQATAGSGTSINFTEDSQLLWPVNGAIIMNYSMDRTVYFSTLDQYKYNPALVIAGAEGDQVLSATPGIVKSIDVTAETGNTVNVDIGNGYELFYGQLKEVPIKVGDHVEAKTVLGYVSQPTKYYSVEGCNVYFEMRKDGQPINPLDYVVE